MKNCYVYKHVDDGEVVYVGKGTGDRAWLCRAGGRRQSHKEWMMSKLPDASFVRIVKAGLSSEAALALEASLIDKLKPKFNCSKEERRNLALASSKFLVAGQLARRKRVRTPDGVFASVTEAALVVGVNRFTAGHRARKQILGWRYV